MCVHFLSIYGLLVVDGLGHRLHCQVEGLWGEGLVEQLFWSRLLDYLMELQHLSQKYRV